MSKRRCAAAGSCADDYEATDLYLAAEWKDHTFTIPRLEWSDRGGPLSPGRPPGAGRISRPPSRRAAASPSQAIVRQLRLRRDLEGCHLSIRPLRSRLRDPPRSPRRKKNSKSWASFRSKNFPTRRSWTSKARPSTSAWDGTRTMLRDIRLRHRSGQLNADLFDAPDDFRLNLDSSLVPDRVRAAPAGTAAAFPA